VGREDGPAFSAAGVWHRVGLGTCRDLPPADQVCIERRCTLVSWHTDNQHSRQHPATGAVGKDAKMPSYIVLVSSLGGIATFGVNGVVINSC
jgi:hypothetical protein